MFLADNIGFGSDGESEDAELGPAVRAADLDQDIDGFAAGLATVVGERGVTLSGGQKQRVSLARAVASGRETLVLDDTLSAVEQEILRCVAERAPADSHTIRRCLQLSSGTLAGELQRLESLGLLDRDERVVLLVTGTGLKDVPAASRAVTIPAAIAARIEAVEELLESS